MTVDPTAVVETVEAVVEATGTEMVAAGTIDYKKVGIVIGVTAGTALGTYLVYRMIKKRQANKELLETAEEIIAEETEEVPDQVVIIEKK